MDESALSFDAYTCRCGVVNLFPSDWHVWSSSRPAWLKTCMQCGAKLPGSFHSCTRAGKRCELCGARVFIGEQPDPPATTEEAFLQAWSSLQRG